MNHTSFNIFKPNLTPRQSESQYSIEAKSIQKNLRRTMLHSGTTEELFMQKITAPFNSQQKRLTRPESQLIQGLSPPRPSSNCSPDDLSQHTDKMSLYQKPSQPNIYSPFMRLKKNSTKQMLQVMK